MHRHDLPGAGAGDLHLRQRLIAGQDTSDRTTYVYDLARRVKTTINALGARLTNVYDAADQTVATIDAVNHRNSFIYD